MKTSVAIFIGAVIGILGGVGLVQVTIAGDVRAHTIKIENIEKNATEEKARTDARIFQLAEMFRNSNELVKASIEQTSRLIATIEAQNQLIDRLQQQRPPMRPLQQPREQQ